MLTCYCQRRWCLLGSEACFRLQQTLVLFNADKQTVLPTVLSRLALSTARTACSPDGLKTDGSSSPTS